MSCLASCLSNPLHSLICIPLCVLRICATPRLQPRTDCNWLFLSLNVGRRHVAWEPVVLFDRSIFSSPFVHGACTATSPPFHWCLVLAPPEYPLSGRLTPLDCLRGFHILRSHTFSAMKEKDGGKVKLLLWQIWINEGGGLQSQRLLWLGFICADCRHKYWKSAMVI